MLKKLHAEGQHIAFTSAVEAGIHIVDLRDLATFEIVSIVVNPLKKLTGYEYDSSLGNLSGLDQEDLLDLVMLMDMLMIEIPLKK